MQKKSNNIFLQPCFSCYYIYLTFCFICERAVSVKQIFCEPFTAQRSLIFHRTYLIYSKGNIKYVFVFLNSKFENVCSFLNGIFY